MENLSIYLGLALVAAFGLAIFSLLKFMKTKKQLSKYSKIMDVEAEAKRIKDNALKLKGNFEILTKRHDDLQKLVGELDAENELAEYGLYKPKYDFKDSDEYKNKLDAIRTRQKEMIKNKEAAICTTTWTVGNSKREGQKMVNRTLKMALNAYNVECDNLILKVNYKNIDSIEDRMDRLLDRIDKFLEPMSSHISTKFHQLKSEELHLVFEFNEKLQEEKEEQRAIREQMREEERAQKEMDAAQKKAEKEEAMYQKALDKVKKDLDKAKDEEKESMLAKIQELENSLKEAHETKERAMSMAQQTKRGHVYIISNIGSFGEEVYKIGMTRRLEPMDRVKELGDASVPFTFDVHAMIYSEDAPGLENELHKEFGEKRLNKINNRKEFFNVTLDQIENFCKEKGVDFKFTKKAEAKEYRQSLALIKEKENAKEKKANQNIDDLDFDIDTDAA